MGRHSKPLTTGQKLWSNIQYYGAMSFFAIVMGLTIALVFE